MGDNKPEWVEALERRHLSDTGRLRHERGALTQGFAKAMRLLRVGEGLPANAQVVWSNTSNALFDETKRKLEALYSQLIKG